MVAPYTVGSRNGLVFLPDMNTLRDRVSGRIGTNDGTDYVPAFDARDIIDAGDEIDYPNIAVLTDITFCAWVRMNSVAGTQRVIQLRGTGTSAPLITLASGRLVFNWVYSTTSLSSTAEAAAALTINTWTHIAVTRTGASAANTILYTNGNVNTKSAAVDGVGTPIVSDADWVIGNTLAGTQPLNGRIADVRVYNRVLTQTEIQAIRAASLAAGTFVGNPEMPNDPKATIYTVRPRIVRPL